MTTPRTFLDLYRAKDRLVGNMPEPQFRAFLDLVENKALDTTSLQAGMGVPPTTALRHLGELVSSGLLVRVKDRKDARRTIYTLSDSGIALGQRLSCPTPRDRVVAAMENG